MRMPAVYLPGGLQAGHARHRDVEDGEIRRRVLEDRQRLVPVRCLGHHLQIGFTAGGFPLDLNTTTRIFNLQLAHSRLLRHYVRRVLGLA